VLDEEWAHHGFCVRDLDRQVSTPLDHRETPLDHRETPLDHRDTPLDHREEPAG
jgi:hypothetical protein